MMAIAKGCSAVAGRPGTEIGVPTALVARLIGVATEPSSDVTKAVAPLGVIAMAVGALMPVIGVSGVLVARLIGVTMLSYGSVTYAVAPLGVMAM